MPNLSKLSPITTAAQALANLILVSPQSTLGYQPQSTPLADGSVLQQPPALLFHYEGEQTANLQSDITDHFTEQNISVEDHIALRPEKITTHGFIGELNDVTPGVLGLLKFAADKLSVISAYTPGLSQTALLAYSEAFFLYQTAANALNAAVSAWSSLSGASGESVINGQGVTTASNQNNQQTYFQQFYGYWRARTLFTVQTPWAVFQNMAIENLRAVQDAETNAITDFEITFKMIRTASTVTIGIPQGFQGRLNAQAAGVTDLGISTPPAGPSLFTNGALTF